jgi:hypothetical protein
MSKAPNLEQLRKQAKDLRRDFASGDRAALTRVRACFAEMTPDTPLSSSRAHLVLARENGFPSWAKLLASAPDTVPGVARDEDRVQIPGLERMGWNQGKHNTYINSLRVVAKALGDDVSYDEIMTLSGAAFRVHLHQPNWCPSAADPGPGFNAAEVAAECLGYDGESVGGDDARIWERIYESVDDGRPVLGVQLIGPPDWGIVAGYDRAHKKLFCRTYFDKGKDYPENTGWPFVFVFHRRRGTRPDAQVLFAQCLDRAVLLAETESFPSDPSEPRYLSGYAALTAWAKQLRESDDLDSGIHANAFCYEELIDARSCASRFLADAARKRACKPLARAADIYRRIAGLLEKGRANAPFPWTLGGRPWTLEMRQAEADALERVLALEHGAIAEIEQARAALG